MVMLVAPIASTQRQLNLQVGFSKAAQPVGSK
jgi:hypothetical protein